MKVQHGNDKNNLPDRLPACECEVSVGTGMVNRNHWALDFVTPAGEVAERVDRHADVSLQCQRVDSAGVQALERRQLFLVRIHEISESGEENDATIEKRWKRIKLILILFYRLMPHPFTNHVKWLSCGLPSVYDGICASAINQKLSPEKIDVHQI